jgi:Glyoxalase-like domain
MPPVDHLMMGVPDFDRTARSWLDRFGWKAMFGSHFDSMPGWGNWIVPLGDTWIEWVGLWDRGLAADPMAPFFEAAVADGERLMGWAVESDDLDGIAARLGVAVEQHQATSPIRTTVWKQAGFAESRLRPYLPFFVGWTDDTLRGDSRRYTMELGNPVVDRGGIAMRLSGDANMYTDWIGGLDLPATFRPGPPSIQADLAVDGQTVTIA